MSLVQMFALPRLARPKSAFHCMEPAVIIKLGSPMLHTPFSWHDVYLTVEGSAQSIALLSSYLIAFLALTVYIDVILLS